MIHWKKRKDGLMTIIGLAKANKVDHVIFYSIYRLGRNPQENYEIAEFLKSCGVSMYFISESCYYGNGMTEGDNLIFAMMSSLAKMERDRKQRRGVRGYKNWRKNNPDKIWGNQPKLRGKTLELFIELYKARKTISRAWDKRRQVDEDGMTNAYSYREMAEVLKVTESTVCRYVKKMSEAGIIEPRKKQVKKVVKHLNQEVADHADLNPIKSKRPKDVDVFGVVMQRETELYDSNGNLHPAYASEEAGPFGKVTKSMEKDLEKMEFITYRR